MADVFHWADHVVFSGVLLASLLIGVVFACKSRRRPGPHRGAQTEDVLLAGRSMSVVPVAFSIFARYWPYSNWRQRESHYNIILRMIYQLLSMCGDKTMIFLTFPKGLHTGFDLVLLDN